ncbi:hypothetical protein PCE1_000615 [Barthelona sp. PCE]
MQDSNVKQSHKAYIGNLPQEFNTEEILRVWSERAGKVGDITTGSGHFAFIEFEDSQSLERFCNMYDKHYVANNQLSVQVARRKTKRSNNQRQHSQHPHNRPNHGYMPVRPFQQPQYFQQYPYGSAAPPQYHQPYYAQPPQYYSAPHMPNYAPQQHHHQHPQPQRAPSKGSEPTDRWSQSPPPQ